MRQFLGILFVIAVWLLIIFIPIGVGAFHESFDSSGDIYNTGIEKIKHSCFLWIKGFGMLVLIGGCLFVFYYIGKQFIDFSINLYNLVV